jgi:DNA-binding transcriptional regulator YdaS (Cro superfamily)
MCEIVHMEQLLAYRSANALTLEGMAAKLGTSPGYLHDLEKGRRKPSPQLANTIERITGISRHELRPDVFGPAKSEAAA